MYKNFPDGSAVRLCSQCRDPGPGQGTRSHMPQLKILNVTIKTQHSQNKQTTTKKPHKKQQQQQKNP